jgi:phthalate 4,5-dioxygenase reductase subunit
MQTDETSLTVPLRIERAYDVAQGVRGFDLVHPQGAELAAFSPGAHLRIRVPNGSIRKYSLCSDPAELGCYQIAVKRESAGRGGSRSLVDEAKVGDLVATAPPENAFTLAQGAAQYLFIAGGIGITPILSMIRSLGKMPAIPWKLHYLTRSPESTAFHSVLSCEPFGARVNIHHDYGNPERSFDLWPLFERPTRAHIYTCGPAALMAAVRDMTGHWSASQVHFESFTDGSVPRPDDRPFRVRLSRSGRIYEVPVGRTILEVLREGGERVSSSCESGSCGTCRTRLLAGEAEHRDWVLMPEETSDQIMICVSRSRSEELLLDL